MMRKRNIRQPGRIAQVFRRKAENRVGQARPAISLCPRPETVCRWVTVGGAVAVIIFNIKA